MLTQIESLFSTNANATADRVWQRIADFADLSWGFDAGIEEVTIEDAGIGMVRKVRMAGMEHLILERLVALDQDAMTITYVIDEDGWPGLTHYVASAKVQAVGAKSSVCWKMNAKVDSSERDEMQAGLDAMAEGLVHLFIAQFE